MIESFRHKGLKRFYEKDERKGVPPELADKVARILARLDVSKTPGADGFAWVETLPLEGRTEGFLVSVGEWELADYFPLRRD